MIDKFYGRAEGKLDAKGRVVLASKFFPPLSEGDQVFLSRHEDTDNCLALWTAATFARVSDRMETMMETGTYDDRVLARLWVSETERLQVDSQRRLVIPPYMREMVGLKPGDSGLVMVGAFSHLEIWDAATYGSEVKGEGTAIREARRSESRGRSAARLPASFEPPVPGSSEPPAPGSSGSPAPGSSGSPAPASSEPPAPGSSG